MIPSILCRCSQLRDWFVAGAEAIEAAVDWLYRPQGGAWTSSYGFTGIVSAGNLKAGINNIGIIKSIPQIKASPSQVSLDDQLDFDPTDYSLEFLGSLRAPDWPKDR